jgi:hypothetical protein
MQEHEHVMLLLTCSMCHGMHMDELLLARNL